MSQNCIDYPENYPHLLSLINFSAKFLAIQIYLQYMCNIIFYVSPLRYDKSAGKLWIYPTNYSVRDYQYNIVQQALLKNTLVTLPTGLGKTFIASVVMYNFYR